MTDASPNLSWWQRLKGGLAKSSTQLVDGITAVFTKRKLDEAALEELEEILIKADLGPATAARLTAEFGKTRFGKDVDEREVREALAAQITALVVPVAKPLDDSIAKPFVVLMVGVNGAGKTTTLGKMAAGWQDQGKKVLLVAADTFRAAAVAQLKVWADRANVPILTGPENADPAALAFQGLEQAKKDGTDIVLIDTAGRLQNKSGLMAELQKVLRVLKKLDPAAPHATLLVLDATAGQNALAQVEVFRDMVQVSGLVVTKLDGSAKAGILVSLAEKFALPVVAVGVGEGVDDLKPFTPEDYARALMGL